MYVRAKTFPTYAIFVAINFGCGAHLTKGMENCEYEECVFTGYTCKNNKCVCDPDEPAFFRCIPPKSQGELCNSDQECQLADYNSYCVKSDTRICKCKRNHIWDSERKKCLPMLDDDIYVGRFDPVRDLVIPGIIIVTIGAMVYLGFKLFCNCGKLWRRRRHQEITRELEEISATPHQQATWIASYRVFSPYNNTSRPPPGLSPSSFPLHPTPCMGLFVPSQLSTSPPSYEEALKHKVILSSYHPTGPPPGPPPGPLSAYTLPPPDVSRQYQTLPANSSSSSSAFILNPNAPPASAIRISTMSGYRSLPIPQTDNYAGLSASHDPIWNQHLSSGTARQVWSPNLPPRINHEGGPAHGEQETVQHSRRVEIWEQQQQQQQQQQQNRTNPQSTQVLQPLTITQQMETQTRTSTFRPSHPARMYHSSATEPMRSLAINGEIAR